MKKVIHCLEELDIFTHGFLESLNQKKTACIVKLSGDLGTGKTALVKSAAKYFHIDQTLTSPTFVIQKEYEIKNHAFFKKLIHIDAYRLEAKSELEYIGWNEIIKNSENIIFIEWPEMVKGIAFPNALHVSIALCDDESREIIFLDTAEVQQLE